MLTVYAEFDRDRVQSLLPAGLSAGHEMTGGFLFGHCPSGTGIAPFSFGSIWIDVEGFDSRTNNPCRFFPVRNIWGEKAREFFMSHQPAAISHHIGDGEVCAEVGHENGQPDFRARVQLDGPPTTEPQEYYYFRPEAVFPIGWGLLPISTLGDRQKAVPIALDILTDDERVQRLRPTQLTGAVFETNQTKTIGTVLPINEPEAADAEAIRHLLLHLLSRFSQAVVIVDRQRNIALMNPRAEELMGDGLHDVGGLLRGSDRRNEATLKGVLDSAFNPEDADKTGGRLDRHDGGDPLIVRSLSFAGRSAASDLVLLVISETKRRASPESSQTFELLGLTPGEAKTAALIGVGLAPRDAAARLGIAESTVRVVLKRAYAKLGLNRQSQLAVLASQINAIIG